MTESLAASHPSAWMLRYELQTYGYVFLLTSRYPSFEGAPRA